MPWVGAGPDRVLAAVTVAVTGANPLRRNRRGSSKVA